jgi:antitoxin FitA
MVSGLTHQPGELIPVVMALWRRCSYYAGMSVAITVRNVPESIRDELAARAARSGRSLQEYLLIQLSELASRPSVDDVIARARDRVRTTGQRLDAEEIIADRDADRR